MSEKPNNIIQEANEELSEKVGDVLSLEKFLQEFSNDPNIAVPAGQYILNAIQSAGKRTVIEGGEELERWQFFDDPWNNGKHAVLGNTRMLNQFVEDLAQLSANFGRENQMMWFGGPTATGKSELKRCLINGLNEYSKTPEGRRYTIEWNVTNRPQSTDRFSGPSEDMREQDWYQSPVQTNPLSVLPQKSRESLLNDVSEDIDTNILKNLDMDPFSKEAYNYLTKEYGQEENVFSEVVNPDHFRVRRYEVDIGQGIGVLHSEDSGSPKERLVGSWMPSMLQRLNSRGRKDPRAFSYDGVIAQGNSGLTMIEDASQHADILEKLLNVPEEGRIKLDNKIGMDLDTLIVLISNPDLDETLNKASGRGGEDPLKPLKRRLDKYEFQYLTNLSLEAQLIRRELVGDYQIWKNGELENKVSERVDVNGVELSPHTIEAAAMFDIVSRLDEDKPDDFDYIDMALLLERGYHEGDDGEQNEKDEYEDYLGKPDKNHGIPVTYTRNTLADVVQKTDEPVMPTEILSSMQENLEDEPMFSVKEVNEYEDRIESVFDYTLEQQESDVIASILKDRTVTEDSLNEYVEHVFSWGTESDVVEPDPLVMKVFETEHLKFDDSDYTNTEPNDEVEEFRRNKVITALGSYAWNRKDEDSFSVDDFSIRETPVLNHLLGSNSWEEVKLQYENFDPTQWENPPSNTETEEVKQKCIENMKDMFGYSEQSAKQASRRVMNECDNPWE